MFSPETFVKIAADSVDQLRRQDVYRVLVEAGDQYLAMAEYIKEHRPDLAEEVGSCVEEL